MQKKVVILGAGLSGLCVANFLQRKGIPAKLFEKDKRIGGLCKSVSIDGFTFDVSGHFLHLQNDTITSLLNSLLDNRLSQLERKASVYAFDKFIPYPFQSNLSYLPFDVKKQCFDDFVN